jgi:hypothetical protein
MVMKKMLERIFKRARKQAKRAAISVLVVLSLAAAMGDRPSRSCKNLDPDYTYLIGNGEPVFRIYSPARRPQKPIAPTIEIID